MDDELHRRLEHHERPFAPEFITLAYEKPLCVADLRSLVEIVGRVLESKNPDTALFRVEDWHDAQEAIVCRERQPLTRTDFANSLASDEEFLLPLVDANACWVHVSIGSNNYSFYLRYHANIDDYLTSPRVDWSGPRTVQELSKLNVWWHEQRVAQFRAAAIDIISEARGIFDVSAAEQVIAGIASKLSSVGLAGFVIRSTPEFFEERLRRFPDLGADESDVKSLVCGARRAWKLLAVAYIILFSFVFLQVYEFPAIALVTLFFVVLPLLTWPGVVTVDQAGISKRRLWQKAQISWSDLARVVVQPGGEIDVLSIDGRTIRFTQMHTEKKKFLSCIDHHRPGKIVYVANS